MGNWHILTFEQFTNDRNASNIYFINDTGDVLFGNGSFINPIIVFYNNIMNISTKAGLYYVNGNTLEVYYAQHDNDNSKLIDAVPNTKAEGSTLAISTDIPIIVKALLKNLNAKMTKVDKSKYGQILTVGEDGNAKASGKVFGTSEFREYQDINVLATEQGVVNYIDKHYITKADIIVSANELAGSIQDASDKRPISEKAFVEAMSWKTTI